MAKILKKPSIKCDLNKNLFHEMLNKMEWEGGIEGFLNYGHSSYTKCDKELYKLFNSFEQFYLDINNRIDVLKEKYGEPEYD